MPHICSLHSISVEWCCSGEHGQGWGLSVLDRVSRKASLRKWHLKLRPEKSWEEDLKGGGEELGGSDRNSRGRN